MRDGTVNFVLRSYTALFPDYSRLMFLIAKVMAAAMDEAKNIQTVIARHTTTVKASEAVNGLVPAMRQIVISPSHAGIEFNTVDLGIINNYRKSDEGRLVIDSYVPALEQALSRPDQYSPYEIGQILSAAREAEQRVYRIQFETLINNLSPDGQTKIHSWLAEGMEQIQYTNVDWAAVGEAAPEYIKSKAIKFTNVQRRAERAALRQQMGQQTWRQGDWIIVAGKK